MPTLFGKGPVALCRWRVDRAPANPAFLLIETALGASSSYVTVSDATCSTRPLSRIDYVAKHLAANAENLWQVALDVITAFDGKAIKDSRELARQIAAASPDSSVKLDVIRGAKPRR